MARITGFFHGGITVSDMDRALRFYHEGLGLEILFDRVLDGPYLPVVLGLEFRAIRAAYLIIPGGGYVELLEYQGIERLPASSRPCDFGAGHLCLYVDDVAAMHDRLVAMGHHSRGGVVDITAGPNQGARSTYLADPDGYSVELFQKKPDA